MAFEAPKAANDNFRPEELEEQRTRELEDRKNVRQEQRDFVNKIADWIVSKCEILRVEDPFGLNPDITRQFAALAALDEVATQASRDIDSVERESSDSTLGASNNSLLRLSDIYEQTLQIVGEDDE